MTPVPRKYGERCTRVRYLEAFPTTAVAQTPRFFCASETRRLEMRGREESFAQGTGNYCARDRTPGSARGAYKPRWKAGGQSYSAGASRQGVPGGPAGARVRGFAPAHGAARTTPEIAVGVFSEFGNGVTGISNQGQGKRGSGGCRK